MLTDPSGRILLACMWMVTDSVRLNTSLSPAAPFFLFPALALELKHILQIHVYIDNYKGAKRLISIDL